MTCSSVGMGLGEKEVENSIVGASNVNDVATVAAVVGLADDRSQGVLCNIFSDMPLRGVALSFKGVSLIEEVVLTFKGVALVADDSGRLLVSFFDVIVEDEEG